MSADTDTKPESMYQSQEIVASESSKSPSLEDPDQAYSFLTKIGASNAALSETSFVALQRKVDWRIVPIMFLCYTMQFIDKVSLNVSGPLVLINHLLIRPLVCCRDGVE